ncbi:MAG: hypothetical protein ACLPTZ_01805 [Beijerinckiaceae bacterium]|jgi:hypothetical protein
MIKRHYGFSTGYYSPDDPTPRPGMFIRFEPTAADLKRIAQAGGVALSAKMAVELAGLLTQYRQYYLTGSRAPRSKQIRQSISQIGKDADRLHRRLSKLLASQSPANESVIFALATIDGGIPADLINDTCLKACRIGGAAKRVLKKLNETKDKGGRGGDPSFHWFIRELFAIHREAGGKGLYTFDEEGYSGPFFGFVEVALRCIPDRPMPGNTALGKEIVRALKDKTKKES